MVRAARLIALASLSLASIQLHANGNASQAANPLEGVEQRLSALYQLHKDAIVKIKVAIKSRDENGNDQVALTVLSGFYIDDKGTVLTNAVPMQEGPRIRVEKDGMQLLAVPIASDPRSNLGLLQVAKPPPNIHYIDLSKHAAPPAIGSLAYAITSPLDFEPTPKLGLVSGRESSFSDIEFPFTYTRISISSGPAEGGSPVFNSDGDLIGISVASLPDIDSSYLVPTKALQRIVQQLTESKAVNHPVIRAQFAERVNPSNLARTIVLTQIQEGSAAAKSGLQVGDQLVQFQGIVISELNALRDAIFYSEAENFVSLIIRRGDEEKEITLLLESK